MRVGFIGLGSMGLAMSERLLAAGFELHVWARRPASTNSLVEQGATLCVSPAALARSVELVCTNVTSSTDVAIATIERSFRKRLHEIFLSFEREPVASASIALRHSCPPRPLGLLV